MIKIEYKNYLLVMLVLVAAFSYFDRFVFALALEPIKQDLNLSDSQLGLMTGFAFAAFYALAGIPIARWADRGNRVTISSVTVGLLSLAVFLCSFVTSFFQLLVARAGVAVGEAGSIPPAQSLIAEYFDRAERPRAMAIYFANYSISMIIGYLLGGWLLEQLGWRTTFMVIGIPGVVIALWVKLTLREPRLQQDKTTISSQPSLLTTLTILWRQRTFRQMLAAFCVAYFFSMGTSQWVAAFFMRSHGMSAAELGAWLALTWGVFGILGNFIGGYYAKRYADRQERRQLRTLAFISILNVFASAMAYLSSSAYMALGFIAATAFLTTFGNGPVFAAIQSLVTDKMRSVSVAIIFLVANLIGFGLGPFALGVVSDLLHPMFGDDSLRYALVVFSPGMFWVAWHYFRASETIEQDIQCVANDDGGHKVDKFVGI